MKTSRQIIYRTGIVVLVLAAAAITASDWSRRSHSFGDEEKSGLAKFMRKKLDASSQIIEGLTVEDAALIRQGTERILEMSKSELWNVILDEDYREYNRDFRSSLHKLERAAEEKNFDNALLQWNDALKGCVECHKYVRTERATKK